MRNKYILFFYTIIYLKPIQVFYQVYYILANRINKKPLDLSKKVNQTFTNLVYTISFENNSYEKKNKFRFLNISHHFEKKIDWELMKYGKLWQYNLSYFNFLNDKNLTAEDGLQLINHFIYSQNELKSSNEPYPISLRVINWIRFINRHQIKESKIIDAIYLQASHLTKRLEYHLLGNHLLENAFCLLHAAKFFSDKNFYKISKAILIEQLNEQILEDGGHFELSPMYHQIILYRVLESIDILKNNFEDSDEELLVFLLDKSSDMLCWLKNITFANGDIPLLNDSANGIAPSTSELQLFAQKLEIKSSNKQLSISGYRKFQNETYEAIVDIGQVGPSYQPGHAHADMLNLIIYKNHSPFLIETGTSTYQINARRHLERSTESHNTVVVNNQNQSEVWSGFRVARRAKIEVFEESLTTISAQSNGFVNSPHRRKIDFSKQKIVILDKIIGEVTNASAHWHFHPEAIIKIEENRVLINDAVIVFENFDKISLKDYYFASQFNQLVLSKKIIVDFQKELTTMILF